MCQKHQRRKEMVAESPELPQISGVCNPRQPQRVFFEYGVNQKRPRKPRDALLYVLIPTMPRGKREHELFLQINRTASKPLNWISIFHNGSIPHDPKYQLSSVDNWYCTIFTCIWKTNINIYKIKASHSGLSITSQIFERILFKLAFIPICHVGWNTCEQK